MYMRDGHQGGGKELRQERKVGESILYKNKTSNEIVKRDTAKSSGINFSH